MLTWLDIFKLFWPFFLLGLLALLCCLFLRPADAARRWRERQIILWVMGFLAWLLVPLGFYFGTRSTGLRVFDLVRQLLEFCLPVVLVAGLLIWRDRARRHLYLVLASWGGVTLIFFACGIVGSARLETINAYRGMGMVAAWSNFKFMQLRDPVPWLMAGPEAGRSEAAAWIPYDEADAAALVDFYRAAAMVVRKRMLALTALMKRYPAASNRSGITIDYHAFVDPAALDAGRAQIAQSRELLAARRAIDDAFFSGWRSAIDSARAGSAVKRHMQADFDAGIPVFKADQKRIDDEALAVMDAGDQFLDVAQRGMGANRFDDANVVFANNDDRMLTEKLLLQINSPSSTDQVVMQRFRRPMAALGISESSMGEPLWRLIQMILVLEGLKPEPVSGRVAFAQQASGLPLEDCPRAEERCAFGGPSAVLSTLAQPTPRSGWMV